MEDNIVENAEEILKKFQRLPKLYQGKEITIQFVNEADFTSSHAEELGLELGATVYDYLEIQPTNELFYLYAEADMAEKVLELPKDATVTARVRTLFGIEETFRFTDEGDKVEKSIKRGLLITEIVNVEENLE